MSQENVNFNAYHETSMKSTTKKCGGLSKTEQMNKSFTKSSYTHILTLVIGINNLVLYIKQVSHHYVRDSSKQIPLYIK